MMSQMKIDETCLDDKNNDNFDSLKLIERMSNEPDAEELKRLEGLKGLIPSGIKDSDYIRYNEKNDMNVFRDNFYHDYNQSYGDVVSRHTIDRENGYYECKNNKGLFHRHQHVETCAFRDTFVSSKQRECPIYRMRLEKFKDFTGLPNLHDSDPAIYNSTGKYWYINGV